MLIKQSQMETTKSYFLHKQATSLKARNADRSKR